MRVLVDGICFQFDTGGIGRFWNSLLPRLALNKSLSLFILDRGDAPVIAGVQPVEFPSYTGTFTASDSLLIQQVCAKLDIDVFTSTYYTSATTTPQAQIVYDLNLERSGGAISKRIWKEKQLTLSYASHFGCISQATRDDLLRYYPVADEARALVIRTGIETDLFNLEASGGLTGFRAAYGLERPYFLVVGGPHQDENDKSIDLIFASMMIDKAAVFDIVVVGDNVSIDDGLLGGLPAGVSVKQVSLSEAELATACSGALALLCPFPYAGCWMRAAEAMACGCPVITTDRGLLGEAPLAVAGADPIDFLQSMARMQEPAVRKGLVEAGVAYVAKTSCDESAQLFFELLLLTKAFSFCQERRDFHRQWKKLRTAQASVDIGVD